jgi:fatty acid desaturase
MSKSTLGRRSMIQPKLKNITAIVYVIVLYCLGIVSIFSEFWQLNLFGVVAIAHSLVISTALTHEFIHGNIFKDRQLNRFWGTVMTHFNGSCYATWDNLVEHHFNHHLYHIDVVGFDILEYLRSSISPWLRRIYLGLEWLYFPVLEFEMRWQIVLAPFLHRSQRYLLNRMIGLMICRTAIFCLFGWISWKAVLLYFTAYISFVNIMRFIDAFHHTYEYVILGQDFPDRDRLYEQNNTFSNLVSIEYPWLNLLVLNFGYHNAHHHHMSCPWHELPALHAKLYGNRGRELLPLSQLVTNYHRFRIDRLFSGQGDAMRDGELQLNTFTGGVGVSLLTPPTIVKLTSSSA